MISKNDFFQIEQIVAKIITPWHIGRVTRKISSGFARFTADQWRNWITVFSPVALIHILPANHLRCWILFVQACYLIFRHIINAQVIEGIEN